MGKPEAVRSGVRGRAKAWLQLLRAPNLLTVPGDPVAGFLLAAGPEAQPGPRLAAAIGAGLAFYAAGLVFNDVADVEVDRAERPARPLPSGRVSLAAARAAGFALLTLGLGLSCALGLRGVIAGSLLSVAVLAYNFALKRSAVFGPLALGLCRSLSMVLGASLVGSGTRALLVASMLLNAFIVMVSYLARTETDARRRGWVAWLPAAVVIGGMAAFVHVAPADGGNRLGMAGAFLLIFVLVSGGALGLQGGRGAPGAIGLMLGALIPLQAAFVFGAGAGCGSAIAGLILIALWPLHRLLSRWFYAS